MYFYKKQFGQEKLVLNLTEGVGSIIRLYLSVLINQFQPQDQTLN